MHLGDRLIERCVVDLLIGVAVAPARRLAACDGEDRRAVQPGVLQPCREIGRADRLRHADANPPGHPGVGVGHVGGSLLRVGQHALDPDLLHLDKGASQDSVHEEDVRHAEVLEGFREVAGAGDLVGGHSVVTRFSR